MTAPRPLGYWVRTVDKVLDEQFEEAAAETGLNRREWQILTRLHLGAVAEDALVGALAPYLDGEESLAEPLDRLTGDGLVRHQNTEYRLTDAGEARIDEIRTGAEERIREQLGDALAAEDYQHLVATLETIARRLGWEPL